MEESSNQNKCNYKKIILQIFIVLFSLILLIVTLITMTSTIKSSSNLAFGKYKFYIMKEGYKTGIAEEGDLIIVKKTKSDEIQIGDNIVYGDNKFYYCDNIIQTKKLNTITKIITAENNGIKYQFDASEIEGKIIFKIHKIGNIIIFLRTPVGIILFILFIICLFALLRVILVHHKNKYSKQMQNVDVNNIHKIND